MPINSLLEYSDNYSVTLGSLSNYYRDEVNDDAREYNATGNYRIHSNKTKRSKPFEYKTKVIGSTPADNSRLDAEIVFPLKYLSDFWK